MENNHQPTGELHKMRANRRVIETACSICGRGFQMAEEVYQCPSCGGYHHLACWEASRQCPQSSQAPAPSATVIDPAEAGRPGEELDAPPSALITSPLQSEAASSEQAMPPESGEPDAAHQRRPAPRLAPTIGVDERRCPSCAEIIKRDALKCRFCGKALDSRLIEPGSAVPDTNPPTLHWALVLGLAIITCGLFTPIWGIRQGVWARKVDPSNKSLVFYVLYFVALVLALVMDGSRDLAAVAGLFRLGAVVLFQAGSFSVKSALESRTGISLSGAMTFFFGPIYHEYHFNQLDEMGEMSGGQEETRILKI
jgi:hypothetical protein